MSGIISLVLAYLLGSVSFSFLIAKKFKGIDIRNHGSKNAGATNTLRVLGKGPAALVLLLDIIKGIVAVLIAMYFSDGSPLWMMLAGLLAIIGHNWPVFLGFKGGKGIATTIGVVIVIGFFPGLLAGIIAIISIIIFRYVSLGSLLFTILLPISFLIFKVPLPYLYGALAIMALSIYRHRTNISRLVRGEESKIGISKS